MNDTDTKQFNVPLDENELRFILTTISEFTERMACEQQELTLQFENLNNLQSKGRGMFTGKMMVISQAIETKSKIIHDADILWSRIDKVIESHNV